MMRNIIVIVTSLYPLLFDESCSGLGKRILLNCGIYNMYVLRFIKNVMMMSLRDSFCSPRESIKYGDYEDDDDVVVDFDYID